MSDQLTSDPGQSVVEVVPGGPVVGSIRPPGSKSLTNRAIICAAFANGISRLHGALRSEDTEVMLAAMDTIGVDVQVSQGGRELVIDASRRLAKNSTDPTLELFIANSGTTVRFLTAALSAAGGNYRLHGVPRMHARPIGDLVNAICPVQVGSIEAISEGGCPPVLIASDGWRDTQVDVGGSVSSQYLSGLMMAAPIAALNAKARPIDSAVEVPSHKIIRVVGELVSRPYVDMTARVMKDFGVETIVADGGEEPNSPDRGDGIHFKIASAPYQSTDYDIEPDASAASYFWAAAAITGGDITVEGLHQDAIQGDVGFCEVLEKMGCEVTYGPDFVRVQGRAAKAIDIDMNSISDTVQTLSIVALFANGTTRVRGVAHNRFKETDRIGDLATELRKLGATVQEHDDGLSISPPSELKPATLETYHDHRMAMSFSLAGLRASGIKILNPACTSKTYPEYFADLERLIGRAHIWI